MDILVRQKCNGHLATLVIAGASLFGASALVLGQWIHYPTPGVPRKKRWHAKLDSPAAQAPGRQA